MISSIGKGPKHGNANKKKEWLAPSINCVTIFIYSKGSRAQFYSKSHFETTKSSNGSKPKIVQNVSVPH